MTFYYKKVVVRDICKARRSFFTFHFLYFFKISLLVNDDGGSGDVFS